MAKLSRVMMVFALLAGCSAAHTSDGDAGLAPDDAPSAPDAACSDTDGDGARDARCGGDDCDDDDPHVGPHSGVCTGATRVRECQGATVNEHDCAAPTPDCDARIGQCAATACGDGVVQPDEQCELVGGLPCVACTIHCRSEADCGPVGVLVACVPDPEHPMTAAGRCVARNVGATPDGARCASDAECVSRYCDSEQARCSAVCWNVPGACMDALYSWCGRGEDAVVGPRTEPLTAPAACHFRCAADADCPAASRCTIVLPGRPGSVVEPLEGTCRYATGSALFGDVCVDTRNECSTNNCLNGHCTHVCTTDADCEPPLPHCAPPWINMTIAGPSTPSVCSP